MLVSCYVRSDNNKYILPLYGNREDFCCRQRSTDNSLRFVSYKKMIYECDKYSKILIKPLQLYGLSKI